MQLLPPTLYRPLLLVATDTYLNIIGVVELMHRLDWVASQQNDFPVYLEPPDD